MAKKSRGTDVPTAGPNNETTRKEPSPADDRALINRRLTGQALDAVWVPEGASAADKRERLKAAAALVTSIKATDEIEGMLAVQMASTHGAAMECMRRGILTANHAFAEQSLKYAAKLMSLYLQQIEALNKYRGKGQQKVTVEYVNVESGGQAIVGQIETAPKPPSSGKKFKDAPQEVAHAPEKPLEILSRTRTAAMQRND